MKKMRSLAVLALVMVASYFVGCSASDEQTIQAPSKPMAEYKAQDVVKETLPLIDAFVEAQYRYALGKDSVPQWDQYLVNPDPNLKQRIDRAVYLRKGRDKLLSYSGHFELVEYSKIVFEKDRWVLDDVVLQYKLPKGNPDQPNLQAGGMNYSFSIKKDPKGEWKILAWTDDNNIVPGPAWDYQPLDKIQASLAPNVDRSSSRHGISRPYNRNAAVSYALRYWDNPNDQWCEYSRNGGDCTNFVSQCLLAGGWQQKWARSRCSTAAWFHNGQGQCWNNSSKGISNYSCSWTSAQGFYDYLDNQEFYMKRRSYKDAWTSAQLGDIVQKIIDKKAVHTMIITDFDESGRPKVTYRTASGYPAQSGVVLSTSYSGFYLWSIGACNNGAGCELQKKREVFLSLFT